jgi:hypothetical protein
MTTLTGVKIQIADVPNRNGRIYPTSVLTEVIKAAGERKILGGMGVSNNPMVGPDISNISHSVSNLRIEAGWLVGDVTVLDTPQGKILEDCIDSLDFRMMGYGSIYTTSDGTSIDRDYVLTEISAVVDGA